VNMDFYDGKQIIEKLEAGVKTGVPARFVSLEVAQIQNLIETSMVVPGAFAADGGGRYQVQNLNEKAPVTALGRQLFG